MQAGKGARPSQGNGSKLRRFLGTEEGIKASCTLNMGSFASCTPDPADICLHRSGDTLVDCPASFEWTHIAQQRPGGSDHHSLVLSVFYLSIKAPASSRFLDGQPAVRYQAYPDTSEYIYSSLFGSLSVYNSLRNGGRKANGKIEKETGDKLFHRIGYSPGNPLTP